MLAYLENGDDNSMTKSSSISSEDINGLKEILEIEKLSRLLEQFYRATHWISQFYRGS
jgi:hypothetical protein